MIKLPDHQYFLEQSWFNLHFFRNKHTNNHCFHKRASTHDLRNFLLLFGLPLRAIPIFDPMANGLRIGTIFFILEAISNQIADFYR